MILNNKDYQRMMDFLYELREPHNDFPHHLLLMLSKYFGYNYLTFFPSFTKLSLMPPDVEKEYYTSFIALNIDSRILKLYSDYYYRTDIFQPMNLPKKLLNKQVLTIRDVMPVEKFQSVEYYQLMKQINAYYQATMYFRTSNVRLGAVGIFREKEEVDFTKKELKILETLCPLITQSYKTSLDISSISYKHSILKNSYERLPIGMLILDSKLSVLECNSVAFEYCQEIVENKLGNDPIDKFDNIVSSDAAYKNVQRVISHLGNSILMNNTQKQDFKIYIDSTEYSFKMNSFLISMNSNNIETVHSIYIVKQVVHTSDFPNEISRKFDLTKRELEIINLIDKGYSNKDISNQLFISSHTVKTHIMNIFKKADVTSRTSLMHKLKDSTN